MHISKISLLRNQSRNKLNTLSSVDQMQYILGFESTVENVYLEANKYRDIDANISISFCSLLCQFCSDNQERLESNSSFSFIKGCYDAYQLCKDEVNNCIKLAETQTVG
jgi:hypothetical protein